MYLEGSALATQPPQKNKEQHETDPLNALINLSGVVDFGALNYSAPQ